MKKIGQGQYNLSLIIGEKFNLVIFLLYLVSFRLLGWKTMADKRRQLDNLTM